MNTYEAACLLHARNKHQLTRVAQLISGTDAPRNFWDWFLNSCLQGLIYDRLREAQLPSRTQLIRKIRKVSAANNVLNSELNDYHVRRFLNGQTAYPLNTRAFDDFAIELDGRISKVLANPAIVGANRKAKSGSGPARYLGCSVKNWVAIIISAAIEYRNGTPTPPRNKAACDAAEALWQASGGHPSGSPGARDSWRKHLMRAGGPDWETDRELIKGQLRFQESVVGLRDAALTERSPA